MLDIIMTHYKEPWDVGKKFFSMLDLQRGVDFNDFRVILVNDGQECALPDKCFCGRPYQVEQISIDHAGVSAARNEGLRCAKDEWVMFCDFDDTFANVYALKDILDVLPAPSMNLLWSNLYVEKLGENGMVSLSMEGLNGVFNHAKVYRRQFLLDHDLWFDEFFPYCEDSLFNTIAYTVCKQEQIGQIVTKNALYIWCDTENSVSNTINNRNSARYYTYYRNKKVCNLYKEYRPYDQYCAMIARTIIDAYYALNVRALDEKMQEMKQDFLAWYHEHKMEWKQVPYETLKLVKEKSWKCFSPDDSETCAEISVTKWLKQLEERNDE